MSTDHPTRRRSVRPDWRLRLSLCGVLGVALALRVWRLAELPPGLHTDEGHYAQDALAILNGARPLFLSANNGREPLFSYVVALAFGGLGVSILSLRLVAAFAGVVAAALGAAVARRLPTARPGLTAVLASAGVGWTFWPVLQSRVGLRLIVLPVWAALLVLVWARALSTPVPSPGGDRGPRARQSAVVGNAWAVLTGVILAAAFYTHLTGRLLPLIPVLTGFWWARRTGRAAIAGRVAVAMAVAGALSAPLIAYLAAHPDQAGARTGQVSVLNPEVNDGDLAGTLLDNAVALAVAPVWRGDRNRYHNLPRRAVFADAVWAIGWLVGLITVAGWAVRRRRGRGRPTVTPGARSSPRRQRWAVLLGVTLAVTVAPSWLSADAPNFLRLTGTWPVLFPVAAVGIERSARAVRRAASARVGPRAGRRVEYVVVALALALPLVASGRDYFQRYVIDERLFGIFNGAATEHGLQLARIAAEGPTFITPLLDGQTAIRVLTAARPPAAFDPRHGLLLPPSGRPARYAFDPLERSAAAAFGSRWPTARAATWTDGHGRPSLTVYALSPSAADALAAELPPPPDGTVAFGQAMALAGLAIEPESGVGVAAGDALTISLQVDVRAPTAIDHNLFVHAVDRAGRTVGQFDGPPLDGQPTTDRWSSGTRIRLFVPLRLAADAATGPAEIRAGWYDWRTGVRLGCAPCPDDGTAARLGTIEILPAKVR